MTASEAALGLASAHRPQPSGKSHSKQIPINMLIHVLADAIRIPADVAQAAVIPPPPEIQIPSSSPEVPIVPPIPDPSITLAPQGPVLAGPIADVGVSPAVDGGPEEDQEDALSANDSNPDPPRPDPQ